MRSLWRAAGSCPRSTERIGVRDRMSIVLALVACAVVALHAQPAQAPQLADTLAAAAAQAEPSGEVSTLMFFNRPIVVLRARVLGRGPRERVTAADRILGQLVESGVTGPVAVQAVEGGALITVGSRPVFGPDDARHRSVVGRNAGGGDPADGRAAPAGARRGRRGAPARGPAPGLGALRSAPSPWGCSRSGASRASAALPSARSRGRREDGREVRPGRTARVAARDARGRVSTAPRQRRCPAAGSALMVYVVVDVRPATLPLYASVGRVDARVPARHADDARPRRRARAARVCSPSPSFC